MARVIIASLFAYAQVFKAPALPCRPSMLQSRLTSCSLRLVGAQECKVQVHRLLDRKEWLGQRCAIACVRGEKDGLVHAGRWVGSQIQSKADVLAWFRRTANSVHFGSLMVIVSVKGAELTPDSWKLKARIVSEGTTVVMNVACPLYLRSCSLALRPGRYEHGQCVWTVGVLNWFQKDKKHIKDPCHPLSSASWWPASVAVVPGQSMACGYGPDGCKSPDGTEVYNGAR